MHTNGRRKVIIRAFGEGFCVAAFTMIGIMLAQMILNHHLTARDVLAVAIAFPFAGLAVGLWTVWSKLIRYDSGCDKR